MISYTLPAVGDNPSSKSEGTTPGSFGLPGRVGTPYMFASPDTPGMPPASDKTAWDFLPSGWKREGATASARVDFEPSTQLEYARLGRVTPQMRRTVSMQSTPSQHVAMTGVSIMKRLMSPKKARWLRCE